MLQEGSGGEFLHRKNPTLHTTDDVMHEQERLRTAGEYTTQKPSEKIDAWLYLLERIHTGHTGDPRVLERIKAAYHRRYITVIDDTIPQSYWNNKAKVMIEQGYGGDMTAAGIDKKVFTDQNGVERTDYIFPREIRQHELAVVRSNQERSLDAWIDYLTSDDAPYPMWAKYWAFTAVAKMGKYEKTEKDGKVIARFQKRSPSTTASFPLLNPRALALTISAMEQSLEKRATPKEKKEDEDESNVIRNMSKQLSGDEFRTLLSTEKFEMLYAQFLLEQPVYSTEGLQEIRGEWRRYAQGSDPEELVNSLQGYPLEWCTADYDTAKGQLEGGDFHIYYSIDEEGNAVVPRLAIRMEGAKIAEPPRGIAPGQNLDPYIEPVLEKKLEEFGEEGELYKKRIADMKRLTEIWEKSKAGDELSEDDLRFIYELDEHIEGFGYERDTRISDVIQARNHKQDLARVLGISEDEVSVTPHEFLKANLKCHYGSLLFYSVYQLRDTQLFIGDMTVKGSVGKNTERPVLLPRWVKGNVIMDELTDCSSVRFPVRVEGDLSLKALKSADGLQLPEQIDGSLRLNGLHSAKGLNLPEGFTGLLDLSGLTSAEGLVLPKDHIWGIFLDGLTDVKGLNFPASIGNCLSLGGLQTAEDLMLPGEIGGSLRLDGLLSAKGLNLPDGFSRFLSLNSLVNVDGLSLPPVLSGLSLDGLESCEGVDIPDSLEWLSLDGICKVEKLKLPRSCKMLSLDGITDLGGLVLPEDLDWIIFKGITNAETLAMIREQLVARTGLEITMRKETLIAYKDYLKREFPNILFKDPYARTLDEL